MARSEEHTALLKQDGREPRFYSNLGYGSRNDIREEVKTSRHLSVEDLIFRLQNSFLNYGYDVEADVSQALSHYDQDDIELLLQSLKASPLQIQRKLVIASLLRRESDLQFRKKRGKGKHEQKKKAGHKFFNPSHIWEGTITRITAYFGSNVASYFRFVRTLLYINILLMVFTVAFIVLPEIGIAAVLIIVEYFVPMVIDGNFQTSITYGGHFGELSNSILFYGLYKEDLDLTYNLPLAYFLTWLSSNLVCFVFIIIVMILRYRRSKLSDDRSNEYKFSWRTFCTWDHSIYSRQGVMDFRTSLRTDIKEIVREEKSEEVAGSHKYRWYVGRAISNLLVLAILVGSGVLIYKVADNQDFLFDLTGSSDFVKQYQLTGIVAGLKFLVPPIFRLLVRIEGWHPRTETNITLARTALFYIASVTIFLTSLYDVTDDCSANATVLENSLRNESCCWENEVGEEVLKVFLVDFGLLIAVGILVDLHRALWVKITCKKVLKICRWSTSGLIPIGYSSFDVVSNVLDVVYGQCLIWLGLYFSPLLATISVAKLFIVFYFRYFIAQIAMVPPKQLFRASSTGNFFLVILLLNFFISLFPMAYAVIEFAPSKDCGPFSSYAYPYSVVTKLVGELPSWLEDVLTYLGTPAVFVPILVLMIMLVIYFKVKSSSYKRLVSELRKQLKFERRVEKRKVFASGRALSGNALNRYGSQDSLVSAPGARGSDSPNMSGIKHRTVPEYRNTSPVSRHRTNSQQTESTVIEEEEDF